LLPTCVSRTDTPGETSTPRRSQSGPFTLPLEGLLHSGKMQTARLSGFLIVIAVLN
jgi:hypothetical protein